MTTTNKTREDRVRRRLVKMGYLLHKTPARSSLRGSYGIGYMVVTRNNTVVAGCCGHDYSETLEDVEAFAAEARAANA